ncbi:MAG: hypothetical protein U9Q21_03260 [Candidatus Auribacterota bacterium]|nr:hypothetical protein [Candidatus Auribacterota bacterium]
MEITKKKLREFIGNTGGNYVDYLHTADILESTEGKGLNCSIPMETRCGFFSNKCGWYIRGTKKYCYVLLETGECVRKHVRNVCFGAHDNPLVIS